MCLSSLPNITQVATAGLAGGKNPGDMGGLPGPITLTQDILGTNKKDAQNAASSSQPAAPTVSVVNDDLAKKNASPTGTLGTGAMS